jgi:hypothetical protein
VLHQDKEFGLEVVDLAKDPLAAGTLARSTTQNLNHDKAPGYEQKEKRVASIGPVSASRQWTAGPGTRAISTPAGVYNNPGVP